MLSAEEIQQIVAESGSRIRQQVLERIDAKVTTAIEDSLRNDIAVEVKKFVAEEVLPEVREQLAGAKAEIVKAAVLASAPIAEALMKALVTAVEHTLADNYATSEILKKLISRY
jgi:hypothetical protein